VEITPQRLSFSGLSAVTLIDSARNLSAKLQNQLSFFCYDFPFLIDISEKSV
jgi:hypothetical protein